MKMPHLFLLIFASPLWAGGQLIPTNPTSAGQSVGLPLKSLSVSVAIQQDIVTTEVNLKFFNPGKRLAEADFFFPLPDGAHLKRFSMDVNGVDTKAELLSAQEARKIYEDIVRRAEDPGLIEYMDGGLIRARIFPIEARGEKAVRLVYQQTTTVENSHLFYRYPLRNAGIGNQPIDNVDIQVLVENVDGFRALYIPTHEFEFVKGDPSRAARFLTTQFKPDRDLECMVERGRERVEMSLVTHADFVDHYFMLSLQPNAFQKNGQGDDSEKADNSLPGKDLVFILDRSGSMGGGKMEQAKAALRYCLTRLTANDHFAVVSFATSADRNADELLPATETNIKRALAYIDRIDSGGGTNIEDAFYMAAGLKSSGQRRPYWLFLTDGEATQGEKDPVILSRKPFTNHRQAPRVFSFGIGDQVNTYLLDRISKEGNGWSQYLGIKEDLEQKISDFYNKFHKPVLTNIRLTINGINVDDRQPRVIPDLFHGSALRVFGRYQGHGKAEIVLEGMRDEQPVRFTYQARFPKNPERRDFVAALWAKRQVGDLLETIRLEGEREDMVAEVKDLSKKYGIVTPYSSLLIVEDQEQLALTDAQEERRQVMNAKPASQSGSGFVKLSRWIGEMKKSESMPSRAEEVEADDFGYAADTVTLKTKSVAGKFFVERNGAWEEDAFNEAGHLPLVSIPFADKTYFKLINDFPDLKPILGLGTQVRFVWDGKRYVIGKK